MNALNIFGYFVSYPSLPSDVPDEANENAIKRGDEFRSYIWGQSGVSGLTKNIPYYNYGKGLELILFQFYVIPCDYERAQIKEIGQYRKKEKSIGISLIIEEDFFLRTDADRRRIIRPLMVSRVESLEKVIKRRRLDTNIWRLILDLRSAMSKFA